MLYPGKGKGLERFGDGLGELARGRGSAARKCCDLATECCDCCGGSIVVDNDDDDDDDGDDDDDDDGRAGAGEVTDFPNSSCIWRASRCKLFRAFGSCCDCDISEFIEKVLFSLRVLH